MHVRHLRNDSVLRQLIQAQTRGRHSPWYRKWPLTDSYYVYYLVLFSLAGRQVPFSALEWESRWPTE